MREPTLRLTLDRLLVVDDTAVGDEPCVEHADVSGLRHDLDGGRNRDVTCTMRPFAERASATRAETPICTCSPSGSNASS